MSDRLNEQTNERVSVESVKLSKLPIKNVPQTQLAKWLLLRAYIASHNFA